MAKRKISKQGSVLEVDSSPAKFPASIPAPVGQQPKWKLPLLYLLLFLLVAGAFLPSVRNGFLFWYGDDTGYVTENVRVKAGLTWEGVKWAFRNSDFGNWHPLTWLSHMLDVQLFGLRPWGHHLTSVLLHAANTLLLFVVMRRMTGALWRSLVVALFFGLHPLRVESVAWVAERKDVLAVFFWMLTTLMYVQFVQASKIKGGKAKVFYALALVGFACGLMSKGMVVTLPFALLLLDCWPLKRCEKAGKLLLEKVPFFGLAVATSVLTYAAQKSWGFVQTTEKYPLDQRLANAMVSYGRYLWNMFWPVNLCGFYPHPGKWPMATVSLAVVFLVVVSILAWRLRRRMPWFGVGWLWYLGTLVPVIGLVQLGDVAMADRYSYIPMVGILIAVVWGLYEWTEKWNYRRGLWLGMVTAGVVGCIIVTRQEITYFKDSVVLWRHNFKVTGNVEVAQYALGLSLSRQGQNLEGIKELKAVVKVQPERAEARFNLGNMLYRQGLHDEAIVHYSEAIRLAPNAHQVRWNLARLLFQEKRVDESVVHFREFLRLNKGPHDAPSLHALGCIMATAGHTDEAVDLFGQALSMTPDARNFEVIGNGALARHALQLALDKQGAPEGITELHAMLKAEPNRPDVHFNLGVFLNQQGRMEEAVVQFREVLRLDADFRDARYNLGFCLFQLGKADEATAEFKELIRLKGDAKGYNALGSLKASEGQLDGAIEYFRKALKEKPDFVDAINNLGTALTDKGQIKEAMLQFQEALRIDPKSEFARTYLQSLQQTGKGPDQPRVLNVPL